MKGDPPLRVWLYRGWSWVCRCCHPTPGTRRTSACGHRGDPGVGFDYPDHGSALAAALNHCERSR